MAISDVNTMGQDVQPDAPKNDTPKSARRPWWRRALKWFAGVVTVVAVLLLLVCSAVVWVLSPERLTAMVEKYGSDYLDAEVKVSRVELSFWSTFPHITIDVDSLSVVSQSLRSLPDSVGATLPVDADSLLSLKSFHGGVNVAALLVGNVSLYDVEFDSPRVNLVQVNDSMANYLIVPPSEPTDTTSESTYFPDITINHFAIRDVAPLRYRSLADSLDVSVDIQYTGLEDAGTPCYLFKLGGDVNLPMLSEFDLDNLRIGALGNVKWSSNEPMAVTLEDFSAEVDSVRMTFSSALDFTDMPMVNSFSAVAEGVRVSDLLWHLPADLRDMAKEIKTDMTLSADLKLSKPWNMADTVLPSVEVLLTVPKCRFDYENVHIHSFEAELLASVNGADLNESTFSLRRLDVEGRSIAINLSGEASELLSDPYLKGQFKGSLNLAYLPKVVKDKLGVVRGGVLSGNTDFRFHMSNFNRENFHRMYALGKFSLSNFDADLTEFGHVYMREALVDFGSNKSYVNDSGKVDSLLTISLKIDTMAAYGEGLTLEMRNFRGGAGTANRRSSADTTEINPFGMTLALERLNFESDVDSIRVRLRDASAGGALRRYKGEARLPQLNLKVALGGMLFGQADSRVALREADADLNMYMRPRPQSTLTDEQRAARRKALVDSLAALPGGKAPQLLDSAEMLFLRRWNVEGNVRAQSGNLRTAAFPLRNRLTNIDLHFTQDSILLRNLSYKAGQSDFLVNGTVSNLRRALTSRRNNTLGMELSITSDTVNVNEIVSALFAGSPLPEESDSALVWAEEVPDDSAEVVVADSVVGPFLVPKNIDARMMVKAKHILYSDLELHSFRGDLMVYDGAINLRNLSASTDIGSISVDALYSGASPDSLQFGLGMRVNRFRLNKLTSLVPAIDSLMPIMQGFSGVVNADVAVTTDVEPNMDINIPSLRGVIKVEGDSLVLLDPDTFKTLSKWLMFKDKQRNMINHMAAEVVIDNSAIELYPFMFDIDRYRLGVMGSNDLAMNLNYHVSVLKSPVPFKFGINIKGTPENMKIRLGKARFKENMVGERQAIADNTRVNIVEQIDKVFHRGISKARLGSLSFRDASNRQVDAHHSMMDELEKETMSYADSMQFIRQGLIENPDTIRFPLHDDLPQETDEKQK